MTPAPDDPPLWLPGWEQEPCDTAPPEPRQPRWMKTTETVPIHLEGVL